MPPLTICRTHDPPHQSYKDPRTGLTHIYVKQLVNGLEVIDGDLNLNLGREGQVLGWGCNVSCSCPQAWV